MTWTSDWQAKDIQMDSLFFSPGQQPDIVVLLNALLTFIVVIGVEKFMSWREKREKKGSCHGNTRSNCQSSFQFFSLHDRVKAKCQAMLPIVSPPVPSLSVSLHRVFLHRLFFRSYLWVIERRCEWTFPPQMPVNPTYKPTKGMRRSRMWVREWIRSFVSQEEERRGKEERKRREEIELKRQEIERDERRSCQEINRSITSTSWSSDTQGTLEKKEMLLHLILVLRSTSFPFQLSLDPLKTWMKRQIKGLWLDTHMHCSRRTLCL